MSNLLRYFFRSQKKKLFGITMLLLISTTIFIMIESAVHSVESEIASEIKPTIGGDIRIESSVQWTKDQFDLLDTIEQEYQGETTQKIILTYTALKDIENSTGSAVQTFSVIAAQDNYPLYGEILDPEGNNISLEDNVYLTQRGYDYYGQQESVQIEGIDFNVGQIIAQSIDEAVFSFANDVELMYLPYDAVVNSSLVQTGSRVSYEWLIKVQSESDINDIVTTLETSELFDDIDDYISANQTISQRVQDFSLFLFVVVLLAIVLAATILFFIVEIFFFETKRERSILFMLGVSQKKIIGQIASLFVAMTFVAVIGAVVLARLGVLVINYFVDIVNLQIGLWDVFQGVSIIAVLMVMASILPMVQELLQDPMNGLKNTLYRKYSIKEIIALVVIQLVGLIVIGFIQTGSALTTTMIVVISFIGGIILWGCKALIISSVMKFSKRRKRSKFVWFDGIRFLQRPGNMTIIMWLACYVTMMSFITIVLFGTHLYAALFNAQKNIPDAFVLNIPSQVGKELVFDDIGEGELFSRIGARILRVNNQSLEEFLGDRISGEFTREFNTTVNQLTDPIAKGKKSILQNNEISLDEQFATRLGVDIGDVLALSIVGREFDMEVVSLRERPEGIGAFFYVQLPQEQFNQAPLTYFATVRSDLSTQEVQNYFVEKGGPGITYINTNQVAKTIQSLTSKILSAVLVFGLLLVALSWLVLQVCLQRMRSLLQHTAKLYFFLGAPKKYMTHFFRSHVGTILLSSMILAVIIGGLLSLRLINVSPFIEPILLLISGILLSVLIIILVLVRSLSWRDK